MGPPAGDDDSLYAGNEPWNTNHTVALTRAWYAVGASPLGNGAGNKGKEFWIHVLKAYLIIYQRMGGVESIPRRGTRPYRPRTERSLSTKWQAMLHDINMFLAADIKASFVIRRSGASEEDNRVDARKFYVEKWGKEFAFEDAYNVLKAKKKWLVDTVQTLRRENAEENVAPVKKSRGGLGSRKVKKLRMNDTGTEDSGEKVMGQKRARQLLKEQPEIDAATAANHAAIAAEQAKYTDRARLHHLAVESEMERSQADKLMAEVDLLKEDNRIMGLDLNGMPEFRVKYFENEMLAACKRQTLRDARAVTELEDARKAAEVARVATEDAVAAAAVAAASSAAAALTTQSVAAADAADAADRANAANLVRNSSDRVPLQDESLAPRVDSAEEPLSLSDGDEGDDETEPQNDVLRFACEVEAFAATRGEDVGEVDIDIGLPDIEVIPATQLGSSSPSL